MSDIAQRSASHRSSVARAGSRVLRFRSYGVVAADRRLQPHSARLRGGVRGSGDVAVCRGELARARAARDLADSHAPSHAVTRARDCNPGAGAARQSWRASWASPSLSYGARSPGSLLVGRYERRHGWTPRQGAVIDTVAQTRAPALSRSTGAPATERLGSGAPRICGCSRLTICQAGPAATAPGAAALRARGASHHRGLGRGRRRGHVSCAAAGAGRAREQPLAQPCGLNEHAAPSSAEWRSTVPVGTVDPMLRPDAERHRSVAAGLADWRGGTAQR
jgi:hypothetical protein